MIKIHKKIEIKIPNVPLKKKIEIKDLSDDDINHCTDILFKNCIKAYIEIILPENIIKKIYEKQDFLNLFYDMKKKNTYFTGIFWNNYKYKYINKFPHNKSFVFGIENLYSIRINNNNHEHAYYLSECTNNRLIQDDKLYLM